MPISEKLPPRLAGNVKDETFPAGQRMSQLADFAGDALSGVMGGMASRYVIDDTLAVRAEPCRPVRSLGSMWRSGGPLRRGAPKTPTPSTTDCFLSSTSSSCTERWPTRRWYRRGVISSPSAREVNGRRLDRFDHAELDRILAKLETMLSWGLLVR